MRHHKSIKVYTCTNRIYRPKKYFYVSLGSNFLLFFRGGPLVVEALSNCPVCPPLNPALLLLPGAWRCRPISFARTALSSKPAARRCCV